MVQDSSYCQQCTSSMTPQPVCGMSTRKSVQAVMKSQVRHVDVPVSLTNKGG